MLLDISIATILNDYLPQTREDVGVWQTEVLRIFESGEYCPIQLTAKIKALSSFCKILENETIKNITARELLNFDKKKALQNGIMQLIEQSNYDYSNCGHSELAELYEKQKQNAERILQIETELKAQSKEFYTTDGEIIYPPAKKTTQVIKFTLK